MMIAATVSVTIPPASSDTPMPIAVVIDFGNSVAMCSTLSPNSFPMMRMLRIEQSVPAVIAASTATRLSFSSRSCLYIGIARQTVAGVSR